MYCVKKGALINHSVINTNIVEWFFGDSRRMFGDATNKL
jgi:hypothetical protein